MEALVQEAGCFLHLSSAPGGGARRRAGSDRYHLDGGQESCDLVRIRPFWLR